METLIIIASLVAIALSAACVGFVAVLTIAVHRAEGALKQQVTAFAAITEQASHANLSLAGKISELHDRVGELESMRALLVNSKPQRF